MVQSEVKRWNLYVDESGNFDSPKRQVVIGAVARCVGSDQFLKVRFRRALREKDPLVPWPFHRWLATKAVMYPLWREQRPDAEIDDEVHKACADAVSVWKRRCPRTLQQVQEKLEGNGEPVPSQLEKLKKQLRIENNSIWKFFKARSRKVCAFLGELYRTTLGESVRSADDGSRLVSFLVGESEVADAIEDGQGDRYFNMLVCLIERVGDTLEHLGGEHVATIHPATRWVKHPVLPDQTTLSRAHVREACQYASHGVDARGARVRFNVGKVWDYDEEVAPGVVVADSIANYFFGIVVDLDRTSRDGELDHIHESVDDYFGFSIKSGEPKLSHVSATGRVRETVTRARVESGTLVRCDDAQCGWAAEQANQWCEYFQAKGE